jgi:hypothetical protein
LRLRGIVEGAMEKKLREYRILSRRLSSKPFFTTGEIAKLLDVNINTVVLWFESGRFTGFKLPGDTARRLERDELVEFIIRNEHPVPIDPKGAIEVVLVAADRSLERMFRLAVATAFGYEVFTASCAFEAGIACAGRVPDAVLVLAGSTDFDPDVFRDCRKRWKHLSYTALAAMSDSPSAKKALLRRGYDTVFPVPATRREVLDLIDRVAEPV